MLVPPPGPKGVIVAYPHTSNWDFVWGVLYRFGYGLPIQWMGKHSLFRWPFGGLLKAIGGIPVDRSRPGGIIGSLAETFGQRDWMWLALTPEGTRSHTDHIKSGFYQLALTAGVPCGLGFFDYRTKTLGIDTYVTFTGDAEADLAMLKNFYADKAGRRPELAGDLRFRRLPGVQPPESPNRRSS